MAKLLTDDQVISALTQAFQDKPTGGLMPEEFRQAIRGLKEQIIRCQECEKWHRHEEDHVYSHNGYCEWLDVDMWDDGFCSEGVEKIE